MILYDWFNHQYFANKYLSGSTYKYKDRLLNDFYGVYWRCTGNSFKGVRLNRVRDDLKDATVKKNMRGYLTSYGYTKAAIDGIIKVCNGCIKAQLS